MGRNNPLAEILGKSLEEGPHELEEDLLEGSQRVGGAPPSEETNRKGR